MNVRLMPVLEVSTRASRGKSRNIKGVSGTLQVECGETKLTYRVMHRQFISLLVAVLIGAMPVAHEICLAGCSEKPTAITHSHHHDHGAQGPEHQMPDHAMDAHAAMVGQHHEPATVKEMGRATECCASVSATPRCCRSRDDSSLRVSTIKRVLEPPQMTVAHVIAVLGPPVGDHPASFVDAAIRPPVSLARLTPLRI